jgi:hypothetical protein
MWKLLSDVLDYHRSLVADSTRSRALKEAIQRVVRPGDVVCDIGAGSGILSLFALQAGARHVYAIEAGAISDIAELVLRENHVDDRVTLIRSRSLDALLPERADVLVSETLWNFGLGEGILRTVFDARERLLRPDARVVPERFSLVVAPIESESIYARVNGWERDSYGIDFSCVRKLAAHNVYRETVSPSMLLADAANIAEVHLERQDDRPISGFADFVVKRPGTLHAVAGWFDATLCPGLALSNAPPNAAGSWKHAIFPLDEPLAVSPGQLLRVAIECSWDESAWSWSVEHAFPAASAADWHVHRARLTTLGGFPTASLRAAPP